MASPFGDGGAPLGTMGRVATKRTLSFRIWKQSFGRLLLGDLLSDDQGTGSIPVASHGERAFTSRLVLQRIGDA